MPHAATVRATRRVRCVIAGLDPRFSGGLVVGVDEEQQPGRRWLGDSLPRHDDEQRNGVAQQHDRERCQHPILENGIG